MCNLNWTKSHGNPLPQMSCDIILDKPKSSYSFGDVLSGQVDFNVSKPFFTWAVRVALEGCAVAKLGEGPDKTKSDTFLDLGVNVFGRGEKIAFPAGEKKLKFSLTLAPSGGGVELPGTTKQSHGFVQYQLIVYMKQELRTFKQAEKTIRVRGWYDLTQDKALMSPVAVEKLGKSASSGMLRFLGGNKGGGANRFVAVLKLNRSGYLAGEEIPFQIDFKNVTTQEITRVRVILQQKIVYSIGTAHKAVVSELGRVDKDKGGDFSKWVDKVDVPQDGVGPSQSGVIDVGYSLIMTATITGEEAYVVEAPIKIGTKM